MKFIKVDNVIFNVEHIACVTENIESVRVPSNDDLPFDDYKSAVNGIRVSVLGGDHYIVIKSETVESFFEKVVAA